MAKQDTDPDVFTEATSMYQRKEDVELDVIYFVSYPKACGGRVLLQARVVMTKVQSKEQNFLLANLIRKGFMEFLM